MSRLVVLDRDGTLIEERPYLSDPRQVVLLPGVAEALRALQDQGARLAVATNQSGVGRGYFGLEAVERVNRRLRELLAREGVSLEGVYVCPHRPNDRCGCRKPGAGLLERAAWEIGDYFANAFVVGDKECDIEMGRRAGATSLLVRTGWGRQTEAAGAALPDHIADDLVGAARLILAAPPEGKRREG
ncbi:MAG: HAD family hydrolase [Chloroflexi bacterium]|nr:HAD family hydrolase [Chloroflexota bacterium]